MIPFHCDALLPEAERYASLKFRRCARVFEGDAGDAVELAAFLAIVPFHWARWIFHWPRWYKVPSVVWAPPEFVQANRDAVDVETALAVVRAMREGGWRRGRLPSIVIDALREVTHNGLSQQEAGKLFGLSRDQVYWAILGQDRARTKAKKVAKAYSALGTG